jgi:hypothetical protein
MSSRQEADFGLDYEPYLKNLDRKWTGQKLILIFAGSFLILFIALFLLMYQTQLVIVMIALCSVMTMGSLFILNGYRLLTRPKDHYLKKKFDVKDLEKLARTKLRTWADKNQMLTRKEAGVYYFYFWYPYVYAPVYFTIKLEANTNLMYVYYLWPKQYFVISPEHLNISNSLSPYRVRKREVERDKSVLKEMMKIIGKQ